jgi:N-ethylmaleimide reductase
VTAAGEIWTDAQGMQPHPLPEAMDADDLRRVREAFVDAARRAIAAGADGVELHGANGYLLAQFLNPRSNRREDGYGGSAGNRRRFVLEVVDATVAAIGAGRVGLRLSPFNAFNDLEANYPGEVEEFLALVDALQSRGLAYLHLAGGTVPAELLPEVRARHRGSLILNGGFDAARAEQALATGQADLVAFGRPFVANPDLVERVARRAPLAEFDPDTLYTPGAKGYTDYPALAEAALA